ncbi:hypothetical protein [Priestia flexa]|uniref:hypothetical protein n=1 Tax=Priestia flexa TaxID=86664 RepID=UPI000956B27B|nr:hypothetical protein [Priestia flexa]MBY6085964.1 hypothetical protein [Priestia flexa]SIQ25440.1 hypothetical protein SAMN05880580_10423 [Priestia flexa]
MSLSEYIIENEKVFKGAHDIKYLFIYLFIPASKPSSHLAVTFSGFNGKEQEGKQITSQYIGMGVEKILSFPTNVNNLELMLRVSGTGEANIEEVSISCYDTPLKDIEELFMI